MGHGRAPGDGKGIECARAEMVLGKSTETRGNASKPIASPLAEFEL